MELRHKRSVTRGDHPYDSAQGRSKMKFFLNRKRESQGEESLPQMKCEGAGIAREDKLLTVAIPCYNSQDYMNRAIESVLVGRDAVEILIIDDGSSDNTGKLADEYELQYPGIVRVIHQENGGHGEAVNTGLFHATGRYYKVLDSDDWFQEEAFLKVLEQLQWFCENEEELDMMIVNYVYEKLHMGKQKVIDYHGALPRNELFTWNEVKHFGVGQNILMHSVIYRTQLLRDCGLKLPKHTFYVDNIFVYHPLPYIKKMYYLDVDLYRYYIGREGQSVNEKIMIGRIDQQIWVTKWLMDDYDLSKIKNKKLRHYMAKYMVIMMSVCTSLLTVEGSAESLEKDAALWEYLKGSNRQLYKEISSFLLGKSIQMKTRAGKKMIIVGYHLSRKWYGFS